MAVNQDLEFNLLVTLMSCSPTEANITQMVALISPANVNRYFGREPLIVHYLQLCTLPNLDILTAFATSGCIFNVHGTDGRTPLHMLVSKELDGMDYDRKVEAIELLVAHGGDFSVVDINGNNVLMVAVSSGYLTRLLSENKAMAKQLAIQQNQDGHDVVALFLLSNYRTHGVFGHVEPTFDFRLKQLLSFGANVTSTDINSDNCLHHLVRGPNEGHPSAFRYKADTQLGKYRGLLADNYISHSDQLIAAGADISQPNKSGLIPLQVALSTEWSMFDSILDLRPLVPKLDVLGRLVPRPDNETMIKEPLNLSVQIWLVAQVTRFGFSSSRDALSIVRASEHCSPMVIKHVIMRRGVNPTANDLKVPYFNRNLDEIALYVTRMLAKDISRFGHFRRRRFFIFK